MLTTTLLLLTLSSAPAAPATKQEARQLAEQDPMVKAGRLQVEVLAWYTEKGYLAFPKAPPAEAPKPPQK